MKKGNESAYPIFLQEGLTHNSYVDSGMSIRLKIASDAMCALISNADRHSQIGDCQGWNYEHLSKIALEATDILIRLEEETRNE